MGTVTPGHVTSRDGTRIGYLRTGSGPGVVLVQGAMADAHAYDALAAALAPSCTVYAADRRGRGMSPKPYDPGHDIARDVEDVDAILDATGADRVFGLSSGAVVALEAARCLDRVARVAAYEPPFYADGISRAGIARLGAEIERGDAASALVTALRTSGTAPAPVRVLPRPVVRLATRAALAVDERRARPGASLRDLLPGIRYDFHDVAAMDARMDTLASVGKPVLLLGGTRSPAFLREALRALRGVLPDARLVEIEGAAHDGPWNGGVPGEVAAALRGFLLT